MHGEDDANGLIPEWAKGLTGSGDAETLVWGSAVLDSGGHGVPHVSVNVRGRVSR